jgi:phage shock protein PspC (stress-responsive transcriptional regulator)
VGKTKYIQIGFQKNTFWKKEKIKMKKLTKSQNNRVLTGTLAGIADYFGIDPTTARVIFVFLSFFLEGAPILLYLLLVNHQQAIRQNKQKQLPTIHGAISN